VARTSQANSAHAIPDTARELRASRERARETGRRAVDCHAHRERNDDIASARCRRHIRARTAPDVFHIPHADRRAAAREAPSAVRRNVLRAQGTAAATLRRSTQRSDA